MYFNYRRYTVSVLAIETFLGLRYGKWSSEIIFSLNPNILSFGRKCLNRWSLWYQQKNYQVKTNHIYVWKVVSEQTHLFFYVIILFFFFLKHNLWTLVFVLRFHSVSSVETGNSFLYLFLIQTVRLGHIFLLRTSVFCSKLETPADPGLRHGPQVRWLHLSRKIPKLMDHFIHLRHKNVPKL